MGTTPIVPAAPVATSSPALAKTKTRKTSTRYSVERGEVARDRVTISKDAKTRARTGRSAESQALRATVHERQALAKNLSSGNQIRDLLSKVFKP
jgi:hypothetical protein